jgi:hypothetical protein
MPRVLTVTVAVLLWALPVVAMSQQGKPAAAAEAHEQTITVKPAPDGCAVSLSTKVGKALGSPEGLQTSTLGKTRQEPLGSIIACVCGAKTESKECPQGGTCACGPGGDAPSVVCN